MRDIVLKVLPPIWFAGLVAVAFAAQYLFPVLRVFELYVPLYSQGIGFLVAIAGFALANYASSVFAIEKTEILPTSPANRVLVTRGPFRYTRNPMYLGMVITILGIAIAFGTLPMFIAVLLYFMVLNFFFIPFEEEKMERQFGQQYRDYKDRVRRWL